MDINVIGTGYVGLVLGACLADMGNQVVCIDVDEGKIQTLKEGKIPIYEPGLAEIVSRNATENRLKFSSNLAEAIPQANVHFIAVGTPSGEDGSTDLSYVKSAASEIGRYMNSEANLIVNKSTVPIGSAKIVKEVVAAELASRGVDVNFEVASNPEFLKEGSAISDFQKPDRIIIGVESVFAETTLRLIYAPFSKNHDCIMVMGIQDAEMTKYAANAMLATKISFMNEIAAICDQLSIDVENVRLGIGADRRIGYDFIYPGCGYGGSCFPKDVRALGKIAEQAGVQPTMLIAVEERNEKQKRLLFSKLEAHFDSLDGKLVAVWGLAFKPGTDDVREAPSVVLIKQLLDAGAKVKAYDPEASKTIRSSLPKEVFLDGRVVLTESQYDATESADCLVVVTDWKAFQTPDFPLLKEQLSDPVIFDGRNLLQLEEVREQGFKYYGIGRSTNA
jgi:UDPglucose 6-dehydrogenase